MPLSSVMSDISQIHCLAFYGIWALQYSTLHWEAFIEHKLLLIAVRSCARSGFSSAFLAFSPSVFKTNGETKFGSATNFFILSCLRIPLLSDLAQEKKGCLAPLILRGRESSLCFPILMQPACHYSVSCVLSYNCCELTSLGLCLSKVSEEPE